jgi:hypothetical protein
MKRTRSWAIALALVAVVALAGACSKTLDNSGLQSQLQTELETQTGEGGWTVACPDDIKVETGGVFECQATNESVGADLTLTITQNDDQGNVNWEVTSDNSEDTGSGDGGNSEAPGVSPESP